MSKQVRINIECPNCHNQYSGNFFRTIWGENTNNRQMVMNDEINIATCPHCGHKFHLPLAMMYVDVEKGFAVWWEPNHDPGIDSDTAAYRGMFGPKNFYSEAPRIADWNEFKSVINEFYDGKRIASPVDTSSFGSISKLGKTKKSGCAGVLAIAIVVTTGLILIL